LKREDLREAAERIRDAYRAGELVVALCDCEVYYSGRSFSRLGRGERVIILKPDGALIVHRPWGYSPVNYQPQSSTLTVTVEEGRIHLRSTRAKPLEVMDIYVYNLLALFTGKLRDEAEFEMWGSEEDIKHAIALEPSILGERFKLVDEEHKMGDRGYADLLLVDPNGTYVVVEIKKGAATREAVKQLKRYVDYYTAALGHPVRGILAAPALAKGARPLLESLGLEYRRVDLRMVARILKSRGGLLRFLGSSDRGSSR